MLWLSKPCYLIRNIVNQLHPSLLNAIQCSTGTADSIGERILSTNGYVHDPGTQPTSNGPNNSEKISKSIKTFLQSRIEGASVNTRKNILHLTFERGQILSFPIIWLRDNCQCANCFDKISNSRIHDQQLLRNDLLIKGITTTKDNVTAIWEDGHISAFSKEWLCHHSFIEEHQKERLKKYNYERIGWNAKEFYEKLTSLRRFSFADILNDDLALLQWLQQLANYGISILTEAPIKSGQLETLAKRVAFIRKTHYGKVFAVTSSHDADNVAYKKGALQLHTDLPYYEYVPGVTLLHCIHTSTNGGENIISDGFNAASQLSLKNFDILSKVIVDWLDMGSHENKKFYSRHREPVLCVNASGTLEKIRWSQPQRDSVFNVPVLDAIKWYDAAIEFMNIIHDKSNAVTFRINSGDILTFDNTRIIHGRTNYTDDTRLLYGAYIDWDEIYSTMRILENELKSEN